ncbi:MAG: Serine/threonine-protein kinase PknD [Phycisphaerae bacterium]|nr:Serine/threonine-protein kinase PknD [Phycisphaerae bacterium]
MENKAAEMNPAPADPASIERIADEFVQRIRRGDDPALAEFTNRHPELADEIRELFPTIRELERAKIAALSASGSANRAGQQPPPEHLGDFRILREIGRGGMGVVYEAEQESLGRRVAIKVLPRQFFEDAGRRQRFEREARLAAGLHHTNIVPVFGIGEHEGHHYYVMQYIRGVGLDRVFQLLIGAEGKPPGTLPDLLSLVRDPSRIPPLASRSGGAASTTLSAPDRVLDAHPGRVEQPPQPDGPPPSAPSGYWRCMARLLAQGADALAFAHRQGVTHRDVKPANLLLDEDGALWVADFGLATQHEQESMTRSGDLAGTLRYMAPERFEGRHDERSDVYSLGITLYELATLAPAFRPSDGHSVLKAVLSEPLAPPRRLQPAMPRDLETVILTATARQPAHRYASAEALRDDLRRFADGLPVRARWISPIERLARWAARNRALAASLSLAAVLLLTVATVSTVAYVRVSRAEGDTQQALRGQTRQRERAEATLRLAEAALDTVFDRLAPLSPGEHATSDEGEQSYAVPATPVLSRASAELLTSLLEFYRRLSAQEGQSRALQLKTADSQRRVGEIHERLGRVDDAQAALAESISRYEALAASDPADRAAQVALADVRNELAELDFRQGRLREGEQQLQSALDLLESLTREASADAGTWFVLARTHYLFSRSIPDPRRAVLRGEPTSREASSTAESVRDRRPRRAEAIGLRRRHLEEATAILNRLCAASPAPPAYRHLLARCLRGMPPARPAAARDDETPPRDRAVQLLEQLVAEFPGVAEYRVDLSETYAMQSASREQLQRAVEMMDALHRERPDEPEYAATLARVLFMVARSYERENRHQDASDAILRAATLQDALARRFPDVGAYTQTAISFDLAAARVLEQEEQLALASEFLERVVSRLDGLSPEDAQAPFVRAMRVRCYRQLVTVYTAIGDEASAQENADHLEDLRREAVNR